jgi:micrococcal nuclease
MTLTIVLASCQDDAPPDAGGLPAGDDATVGRIVDGDTLRTADDERIRLLNIDTPEPSEDECWSAEATDALTALVPPGTEIRLVYDQDVYDRYGRTLAHIYRRRDGLWVNLALVEQGAALPYVLQPNDTQYAPIQAAADDARRAGLGLWGACER